VIDAVHREHLAYDDQGDGLTVVFLHGFPHDRSLWSQQRIALAQGIRRIVPDLRGFGASAAMANAASTSIDDYADDIISLLDALDIERAVLCGLSMGGYIAMALWRRYPHRVQGLVLCDTKATADDEAGKAMRDESMAFVRTHGSAALAERQLPKMLGATTHAQRDGVVDEMRAMMARQSVDAIVGALTALRNRPDSRATLPTITVPTLIIVGDEDTLTPPADAERMRELLPASLNARIEIIAEAGHVTCVERPAAVTHVLADFLASFDSSSS
jgi:3-oxoadipate enol-lactonase